jgi:hypothetical protein
LIDWIYEKGRISESNWQEIKKHLGGEPHTEKKEWEKILYNKMSCVVESVTLSVMEEFDILQKLIDMGIILLVGKNTADQIRYNNRNIEFGKEVADWHKELIEEISENSKFVECKLDYGKVVNIELKNVDLYFEASFAPMKYNVENDLYLLTDDRWTQRLSLKHFGTDVLLTNLFEHGIINIEEYTNSFLKLCEWRYRFLLPDTRILVFLAKQYKKSLPGKDLELIATYLRNSLEDVGLPLISEPTTPPQSVAMKYFSRVIDIWLEFLSQIWQDDMIFEEESLCHITDWFYRYAMPDFPKGINEEMRMNFYKNLGNKMSFKLFSIVISTQSHMKLYNFIQKVLDNIFDSFDKKVAELTKFVKYVKTFEFRITFEIEIKEPQKAIKQSLIIKILETFFGKAWPEIMEDIGRCPELAAEVSDIIPIGFEFNQEESDKLSKALSSAFQNKENVTGITPIIIGKLTPKKSFVTTLHDLIMHPSDGIKMDALTCIMDSEFVTDHTKKQIEKLKERLISSTEGYKQAVSEEIRKLLLKDYQYGKSLFNDLKKKPFKEFPIEFFDPILEPDLSTVIVQLPQLLSGNFNTKDINSRINKFIIESSDLNTFLDYFLKEYFFVPLGPPLNPWRFVETFMKRKDVSIGDTLKSLKMWTKNNDDPLAYLMALEIVLNLRAKVKSKSSGRGSITGKFKGKHFMDFLNRLLEVLLMAEKNNEFFVSDEEVSCIESDLFENIRAKWFFKKEFSRYYLKYIDLNYTGHGDDEYRVLLAWRMAIETEIAVTENFTGISLAEQTLWLWENTKKIKKNISIALRHHNLPLVKEITISRFFTLDRSALTLKSLALAIISPANNQIGAFRGIKEPTTVLRPRFRDKIISSLPWGALYGEVQVLDGKKGALKFLWEFPYCITAPKFLREYYGDAFDLLGKDKVITIQFTESLSNPSTLTQNLTNLLPWDDDKQIVAIFTLSSCEAYVTFHGEMPEGSSVFKDDLELIKNIIQFDSKWAKFNPFCFYKVISILHKLIAVGNYEWTEIIQSQLKNLDYDKLAGQSDTMKNTITEHITIIVTSGYELTVLEPILELRHSNKTIREILGILKEGLEENLRYIPTENRENIRKFLNRIADIPSILPKNIEGR